MTTWPTVMVTGHRPQHLKPAVHAWVRSELDRLAVKLRDEHGMAVGVSGMAIGADLWWADAVICAGVKLDAHVPFPQQPDKWQKEDRDEWMRLCRAAWTLKTYGGYFDVKTLHARNDGMIKAADVAIAVHLPWKASGGTASAVEKLTGLGKPIIHVNPAARVTTIRMPQPTAA
ncbi:hypothetical protein GCM10010172_06500 [Paractinoplanes ferrugineus]|uniref:DprA-like DNA processing chain A n=1 Tax=Paractinoplanes ferrugineus TaxID=113564 RepID=A0A919MQH2_9ACTN|nr:SLOG family protein [Actinoplanes ferrugineus]GIE16322.1 hypothetical protein Afe05nite_81620 [Actinoplanes ferrugineus]